MSRNEAYLYLVRLTGLHLGAVFVPVGILLASLGASVAGAVTMLVGVVLFAASVLSAGAHAMRHRVPGTPMFGPESVAEQTNQLTGWWYLPSATRALGLSERRVRTAMKAAVVIAVASFLAVPVAALLTR
jgi:hypothetical protein